MVATTTAHAVMRENSMLSIILCACELVSTNGNRLPLYGISVALSI